MRRLHVGKMLVGKVAILVTLTSLGCRKKESSEESAPGPQIEEGVDERIFGSWDIGQLVLKSESGIPTGIHTRNYVYFKRDMLIHYADFMDSSNKVICKSHVATTRFIIRKDNFEVLENVKNVANAEEGHSLKTCTTELKAATVKYSIKSDNELLLGNESTPATRLQ